MIVTLRLAEEKIKESHFQKGGVPPRLCRLVGSLAGAPLCAIRYPGRPHLVVLQKYNTRSSMPCATTYNMPWISTHYIPGDLSTGYPQIIMISY